MNTVTLSCAVCGAANYWVGWVSSLGEARCINHLDADSKKSGSAEPIHKQEES